MRVVFGAGRIAALTDEVDRLGLRNVLILCSPRQRALGERVASLLPGRVAGVFAEARMHVPIDTAAGGEAETRKLGADGCVSVGGGSAVGLGKAIALATGVPTVCVPTTYSGSEMTPVWGLTDGNGKATGRDPVVLPRTVIYDPELTFVLPADVSATSGMNAIAHAVEALYAPDGSPMTALMAQESVRCLAAALPGVVADPYALEPRTLALRGAWLAGACLGATTMSLHHKICHALGGLFDLPHAATHAVVLPHVAAFNLPAAPEAEAALARALHPLALRTGTPQPPGTHRPPDSACALAALVSDLGIPPSLAALGLREQDLPTAADAVLAKPYANPRPVTRDGLLAVLGSALRGDPPEQAT